MFSDAFTVGSATRAYTPTGGPQTFQRSSETVVHCSGSAGTIYSSPVYRVVPSAKETPVFCDPLIVEVMEDRRDPR